ncbi:enolase C-terminal domain-like protein [Nocardia niigatensis]
MAAPAYIIEVKLRLIRLGMRSSFRSAVGKRDFKEAVVVEVHTSDGIVGYGELACRPDPYYSHEYNAAAIGTLQRFFIPPVLNQPITRVQQTIGSTPVRGWSFTRHSLEAAVSDAIERSNSSRAQCGEVAINVGFTSGISTDEDYIAEILYERSRQGYRRIRFKANAGDASRSLISAIERTRPGDFSVAIDFNGSLSPDSHEDTEMLRAFASTLEQHSGYIEQPYPPGQLIPTAVFRNRYSARLSLDEDITELSDLQIATVLKAIDICNIKPGRVGGLSHVYEMADHCGENNIDVQLGGMLETGIGRWANARIAARIAPDSCHDMSLPRDYLTDDVVAEAMTLDAKERTVTVPDRPVAIDLDALNAHTVFILGSQSS